MGRRLAGFQCLYKRRILFNRLNHIKPKFPLKFSFPQHHNVELGCHSMICQGEQYANLGCCVCMSSPSTRYWMISSYQMVYSFLENNLKSKMNQNAFEHCSKSCQVTQNSEPRPLHRVAWAMGPAPWVHVMLRRDGLRRCSSHKPPTKETLPLQKVPKLIMLIIKSPLGNLHKTRT